MKNIARVGLFVVFAIVAFQAPDAFAIDNCQRCEAVTGSGSLYVYCNVPPRGEMGTRYCFVDYDGEMSFCQTVGDWCCSTGQPY